MGLSGRDEGSFIAGFSRQQQMAGFFVLLGGAVVFFSMVCDVGGVCACVCVVRPRVCVSMIERQTGSGCVGG